MVKTVDFNRSDVSFIDKQKSKANLTYFSILSTHNLWKSEMQNFYKYENLVLEFFLNLETTKC